MAENFGILSGSDQQQGDELEDVSESYINRGWRYDVFLSFRGEDTRRGFTSHLHNCLLKEGINAFIDNGLPRGEDISTELIDTIRSSRISVVVFSRNYANSSWCLDELSEIMECKKSIGQKVFPVFYDVDPSDVRKQKGLFQEAFAKHEHDKRNDETIARWKAALAEAGSLSGWDLSNPGSGTAAEIVMDISRRISSELVDSSYLDMVKNPVGLESRMIRVIEHLNDPRDDVRFIVIWGMGGVGKTTLAKAVFNQFLRTFEAKCFLANVGETSEQHNGLLCLQEKLLHETLKSKIEVRNIDRGCNVIKERLRSRRVLLVLDDVRHQCQLDALAREREWFGPGSRIIITTRDQDSVKQVKADFPYLLPPLDFYESLQLFRQHAFQSRDSSEEFSELAEAFVGYCDGLPLALEVLGKDLFGQSARNWKSKLERLRRAPNRDMQKKLETSYHGLPSDDDKNLFLDIACFFTGWDKDHVVMILGACGLCVELGLDVLSQKTLVKISNQNKLKMHDVIRDMGREIVRKEYPQNPGKRSRLFSENDVLVTLQNHLGTEHVEGILFHNTSESEHQKVNAKAFERMKLLRLLKLESLHIDGDYSLISKELRLLCWRGFPLNFIPNELFMENLIFLDMQHSKLRSTWKASKSLQQLKVLNLSHSHFLTKTPDFSSLPWLEELMMEDCKELRRVHSSIGGLNRIVLINLKDCKKLGRIPDSICNLKRLQVLDIRGCSGIGTLPDDIGRLESLRILETDGAPTMQFPQSIALNLNRLLKMSYSWEYNLWRSRPSLTFKRESPKDSDQLISPLLGLRRSAELISNYNAEVIGSLKSLIRRFKVEGSNYIRGPAGSIISHACQVYNYVDDNRKLVPPPEYQPLTETSHSSTSYHPLRRVSTSDHPLQRISVSGESSSQAEISSSGNLDIHSAAVKEYILEDRQRSRICFRGTRIPEWFEYQSRGASISFRLPLCHSCELRGVFLAYITTGEANAHMTGADDREHHSDADHTVILYLPSEDIMKAVKYRGTKATIYLGSRDLMIKRVGVHLEVRTCRRCRIINVEEAEVDPSPTGMDWYYEPEEGRMRFCPSNSGNIIGVGDYLRRGQINVYIAGAGGDHGLVADQMSSTISFPSVDITEDMACKGYETTVFVGPYDLLIKGSSIRDITEHDDAETGQSQAEPHREHPPENRRTQDWSSILGGIALQLALRWLLVSIFILFFAIVVPPSIFPAKDKFFRVQTLISYAKIVIAFSMMVMFWTICRFHLLARLQPAGLQPVPVRTIHLEE